ncbi:MAG: hypothetical protein V1877_00770 [Candidatus Tagabacteria bacterium]
MMKKILIKVWQREFSPGQALNLLQDEAIRDGPKRFWLRETDDRLLHVLEAVYERAITVNEAEQEIREMEEGIKCKIARKRKAKKQTQAEESCA